MNKTIDVFYIYVGMMTTVVIIGDMTMGLQDGVHMTDHHLEVSMTHTWTDALLLAGTTMVMVVIHTEAGVLEDLPQGIYTETNVTFLVCKKLVHKCIV